MSGLTQNDYATMFDDKAMSDEKRRQYAALDLAAGSFKRAVCEHCPAGPETDKILQVIQAALIQATVGIAMQT